MRNVRNTSANFSVQDSVAAAPWLNAQPVRQRLVMPPTGESWNRISFALVWILAFVIPWGDMVLLPYDVQASRVFTLVAAFAWMFHGKTMKPMTGSHWFLLLFVLWAGANILWTVEPERAARRAFSYCQLFLDAWLIFQCCDTAKSYRRLLGAFLMGCGVAFSGLLYNFAIGEFQGDGRYAAPGFDPNDLAATLILGIPGALYFSFSASRTAWIAWLYVPGAVLAALLTASRSALIALVVCLVIPLVAGSKVSMRSVLTFGLLALASWGLLTLFWNEISFRRLSTISEQLTARDLNGRVDIWERGFSAFLENPLIGVGGGGFGTAVGGRNRELAAHNTGLGILVEHGLIGLTLWAGAVISLILRTRRQPGLEIKLWLVTLGGWAIAGSTLSWENREITWLLFGLCSGAASLCEARRQSAENDRRRLEVMRHA